MPYRSPWDGYILACEECPDGLLEPVDEGHHDREDGMVRCTECEVEFRLQPVPRGRETGHGECPECEGELRTTEDWALACEDCGRRWRIGEVSWLRPETGDGR